MMITLPRMPAWMPFATAAVVVSNHRTYVLIFLLLKTTRLSLYVTSYMSFCVQLIASEITIGTVGLQLTAFSIECCWFPASILHYGLGNQYPAGCSAIDSRSACHF